MEGPSQDPRGTAAIAQWARRKRVSHQVRPDQSWFRRWEPFDTMISPSCYLNACSWPAPPGNVTLAEPWTEEGDDEPMGRTLVAFVSHPKLQHRASMRSGEHFITRVTFLEAPPLPEVELGDPLWDEHVSTRAASVADGAAAFRPELRQLLAGWGFRGHLEIRPGGMVLHYAGLKPIPEHLSQLGRIVSQVLAAALGASR